MTSPALSAEPRDKRDVALEILLPALRELVCQIGNNDFVDSHGHEAIRLLTYAKAQRAIMAAEILVPHVAAK